MNLRIGPRFTIGTGALMLACAAGLFILGSQRTRADLVATYAHGARAVITAVVSDLRETERDALREALDRVLPDCPVLGIELRRATDSSVGIGTGVIPAGALRIVQPVAAEDGQLAGHVILCLDLKPVEARLQAHMRAQAVLLLLWAAAAVIVSMVLTGRLSSRIGAITRATAAIGEGMQTAQVSGSGDDEFRALISAINEMADRLRAKTISKSFLDAVIESMAEGLCVIDLVTGRIAKVNAALRHMTGYVDQELVGRRLESFFCEDLSDWFAATALECTTERGRAVPRRLQTRDGRRIPVEISIAPLPGEHGDEAVCVIRDMTLYHQAQEELTRSMERAKEVSQAKSDFLANMSHEIRTPMNAVLGMAGLLLDSNLNDDQRECAETLKGGAEGLLRIVGDVLDFSKIEAGRLDIVAQPFDLWDVVEGVGDLLGKRAAEKGIELNTLIGLHLPTALVGDAGRLRQVLANLVGNAIKFTPAGEVAVQVTSERENESEIVLRFEVRDTGRGIPGDKIAHLFEAFAQVDTSLTREFGGTGLGLTISKRLVHLMGGEIGVASEVGAGSTFWFKLSFVKGTAAREVPGVALLLQDKRILLVDDNATCRRMLAGILTNMGGHVQTAGDAATARIYRAAADPRAGIDLLIVDADLCDENGTQLWRSWIRPRASRPALILLANAPVPLGDAGSSKPANFLGAIRKPIKRAQVKALLKAWARPQEVAGPEVVAGGGGSESPAVRILVAEDNRANQMVVCRILQRMGYETECVADGQAALQAVQTDSFDLVLMDCQMPVMDGYAATRAIRGLGGTASQIPIVALTAHAMPGDREKCLGAGMDDYVPKPIQPKELRTAIERVVRHSDAA